MDRTQKEAFVADLNAELAQAASVVVGHYRGLTVAEMEELRAAMGENGGRIQVAKNRLAKIAFDGTPYTNLADDMEGPTLLAFSTDPISAAKVTQGFADKHEKFVIIGGAMGERKLDAAGVKALSSMPSLDELRAKLVGLVSAPATKVATVTQEPAAKLARVLAMKSEAA